METRPTNAQPKIWIDATGCFIWGNQPPTGVTRVEATVLRAAIDAPEIGIAYLDKDFGRYRPAGPDEMIYLKEVVAGLTSTTADGAPALSGLSRLRLQLRFFTQETARRWAASITGRSDRKGAAYSVLRTALRAAVAAIHLLSRPLPRLWSAAAAIGAVGDVGIPQGSMVLVSHMVDRRRECWTSLAAGKHRATHIVHDIIPLKWPDPSNARNARMLERLLDRMMQRNDSVITVSEATRDDLIAWLAGKYPAAAAPETTPCRLDQVGIAIEGQETPDACVEGRKFALFCSTFNYRKNHDFLVPLWRRLHERLGADTPHLLLVGRDGHGTARFRAALAEAGDVAEFIHVAGTIDEPALRWAYRNAAFGVFPSSQEGWGLGVSECLQFGTPVLHTDTPQLREAARGVMPALPERDLDAWTEAVLRIAGDRKELDALRTVAEKDYRSHSSGEFAKCVIAILKKYERVTAQP